MEHRHRGARQDLLRCRQQGLCLQAADSDADANANCYGYSYSHGYCYGNSHLNSDTYSRSKPDTDSYGYSYDDANPWPDHAQCDGLQSARATTVDLSWSGATSGSVDIYRNGALIVTTGTTVSTPITGGLRHGTYTYQVCNAGTQTCSNQAR